MKCSMLAIAASLALGQSSLLRGVQPLYSGKVNNNAKFAVSAQSGKPARAPGYRSAWDDCGGVGASATERMRTIASKIKGWAKPLPFVRHAAQDCGKVDAAGTKPGPGARSINLATILRCMAYKWKWLGPAFNFGRDGAHPLRSR